MDPGLFIAGMMGGLLLAWGWQDASEQPLTPSVAPGLPEHPRVAEAKRVFLPATADNINAIQATDPQATTWKKIAAHMPYLTEAVAMYYTMNDPRTPMQPKLVIAGSLLYLVSPVDVIPDAIPGVGQLDDMAVLLGALKFVYDMINPEHMKQAQAWLISQGIEPKPIFAIGKDFSAYEKESAAKALPGAPPQLPGPAPAPQGPQGPQGGTPAAPFNGW
jgi:uncharacterized membrane protein YkvA (DUF1232 family)